WYVKDLNSTNGVKVNGAKVIEKLLKPGDDITVGKRRKYKIQYTLPAGRTILEEEQDDILSQSLLERAGLERPTDKREPPGKKPPPRGRNFDPADFLLSDDE